MIAEHITFSLIAGTLSILALQLSYYNSKIKSSDIIKTLILLGISHSLADGYSTFVSERAIKDKITHAVYDGFIIFIIYILIHIIFIIPFLIISKKNAVLLNYIIANIITICVSIYISYINNKQYITNVIEYLILTNILAYIGYKLGGE